MLILCNQIFICILLILMSCFVVILNNTRLHGEKEESLVKEASSESLIQYMNTNKRE